MRRAGNLYVRICDPDNLREAFLKARRGKSSRPDVMAYVANLDANLADLRRRLENRDWAIGDYRYFTVFDPKERTICAAPFSERVLHHAVMNVCEPLFEKWQTDASHACRKGRGLDSALAAARRNARRNGWHLKLDVRKYFDSIPHDRLLGRHGRRFQDPDLMALFAAILDTYGIRRPASAPSPDGGLETASPFYGGLETASPVDGGREAASPVDGGLEAASPFYGGLETASPVDGGLEAASPLAARGLPIGNLTSQFFANFYLEPLDRYVKETLRASGYVRYMDDFALWGDSREAMKAWEREVRAFCRRELGLTLKPPVLNRTGAGLPFLGYIVRPGKLKLGLRARRRFAAGIRAANSHEDAGRALALLSFAGRADSAALRRKILYGAPGDGVNRVNRGGSWNNDPRNCRSANRDGNEPGNRDDNLGFRVALAPAQGQGGCRSWTARRSGSCIFPAD